MMNFLAVPFPEWLTNWDLGVDNWIQSWACEPWDSIFTFITKLGDEGFIWIAIALIGATTFCMSALGVKIGNVFGSRFEKKAQTAGGMILIFLGIKIQLEHLGVWG